jgi:N4-gp56 family major capsid protein
MTSGEENNFFKKNIIERKKKMDSREFISKAYDSNAFTTAQTTAGYINPEVWNKEVLTYTRDALVVAPLGKQYNDLVGRDGDVLHITISTEPAAASAVAESASSAVIAYEKTQVDFTPSEYSATYQLTNKEKTRSFINLMQDMTMGLGHALARAKDAACVTLLQASAGNTVVANGVTSSDVASSDIIDYDDIVNAKKAIMVDKLFPSELVVSAGQYGDLLKLAAFRDASQFGDQVAKNGFIGRISGLDVFWTTAIAPATNKSKAIMLGKDASGVPSFGIAYKRAPYLETEYHAMLRYTDIVAVEEWDIKVLRANGICTIESYDA